MDASGKTKPKVLAQALREGSISRHAYYLSPDGKTLIHDEAEGILVQRGKVSRRYRLEFPFQREVEFSPTNPSLVAIWAPQTKGKSKGVALLDLTTLAEKPALRVIYRLPPSAKTSLNRFRWSPKGDALLLLHSRDLESYTHLISEVRVSDGRVREYGRAPEGMGFMAPYTDPKTGEAMTLIGGDEGISLLARGKPALVLSKSPLGFMFDRAATFRDGQNRLAVAHRGMVRRSDGTPARRGVYLVDVEGLVKARAKGPAPEDERGLDFLSRDLTHTLWFSPKGTYLTGATEEEVILRRTKSPREKPTVFSFWNDKTDSPTRIRGVAWNADETKLALVADRELWVYDWTRPGPAKKDEKAKREEKSDEDDEDDESRGLDQLEALTGKRPALYRVAEFKQRGFLSDFLAEPQWIGDRIVLSRFEDVAPKKKPTSAPTATPAPTPAPRRN